MLPRFLRHLLAPPNTAWKNSPPSGATGSASLNASPPEVAFVMGIDRVRFVPGDVIVAPLASTRLRTLIPAGQLAQWTRVALVPWATLLDGSVFTAIGVPNALVLSKLSMFDVVQLRNQVRVCLERLRELHGTVRLVADVSDDYAAMGTR